MDAIQLLAAKRLLCRDMPDMLIVELSLNVENVDCCTTIEKVSFIRSYTDMIHRYTNTRYDRFALPFFYIQLHTVMIAGKYSVSKKVSS